MRLVSVTNVVLAFTLLAGAQAQQPQAASSTSGSPCPKAAPSQPHKQGWLEQKARALACSKNANLCNLPSSADDAMGTQTAKPCAQTPAPKTPIAPSAPVPQFPAPNAKPALVCPPKTVLIANTRYCLTADNTTVDAIQLQPNQPIPAAQQH